MARLQIQVLRLGRAGTPHVHVVKDGKSAKVWLKSLEMEYGHGYNQSEIAEFSTKIAENRDDWMEKWNDFFGV